MPLISLHLYAVGGQAAAALGAPDHWRQKHSDIDNVRSFFRLMLAKNIEVMSCGALYGPESTYAKCPKRISQNVFIVV